MTRFEPVWLSPQVPGLTCSALLALECQDTQNCSRLGNSCCQSLSLGPIPCNVVKISIPSFVFCLFWFDFFETRFLDSLDCPGTGSLDQVGRTCRDQPYSTSQVLGLNACYFHLLAPTWFYSYLTDRPFKKTLCISGQLKILYPKADLKFLTLLPIPPQL